MKVEFVPGFTPAPQPPAREPKVALEVSLPAAGVLHALFGALCPAQSPTPEIENELHAIWNGLDGIPGLRNRRPKLKLPHPNNGGAIGMVFPGQPVPLPNPVVHTNLEPFATREKIEERAAIFAMRHYFNFGVGSTDSYILQIYGTLQSAARDRRDGRLIGEQRVSLIDHWVSPAHRGHRIDTLADLVGELKEETESLLASL